MSSGIGIDLHQTVGVAIIIKEAGLMVQHLLTSNLPHFNCCIS